MSVTEAEAMMRKNIEKMNENVGYDVIIVCCSSSQQARYWQKRLEDGRGSLIPTHTVVLAVKEDWPGGAGNALGTLYAYKNATSLALQRYGLDIDAQLDTAKISIALYHTAGKGTRLAPLPGAENNNKPGVKLPTTIKVGAKLLPMTILEAVVKQTSVYARSRAGRLSVYWGDQVFIPTVPVEYTPSHHVDILCSLGPTPSESEWQEKGLDKYGLIAATDNGDAAQVDKVDHATATQLLASFGKISSVGVSLGSFSVSSQMLFSLLKEFSQELLQKVGKLDSDPHLWMPMTLEKSAYIKLMAQKEISADIASLHFDRIAAFLTRFKEEHRTGRNAHLGIFGPVDVGQGVYWWDFGQLKLYQRNALLMASNTSESELMRQFFGIGQQGSRVKDSAIIKTSLDTTSCVSSSHIGTEGRGNCGSVRRSILCNVRCKHIDAEDCILVNVTADSIVARPGCIVYNIVDETEEGLDLNHGQVLAGVFSNDGSQIIMRSTTTIDGGKAWEQQLEWNPKTFEDVYNMNTNADPINLERQITSAHSSKWRALTQQAATPQPSPADQAAVDDMVDKSYWRGVTVGGLSVLATLGAILFARLIVEKRI